MKSLFYTLIILCISTQLVGQVDFREGSWDDILEMARTENKPIFLDAYAVWCGPCKMMDKQVFPQPEVGEFFNENFINAKIDMEKGEGRTLQGQYQVTAFPTLLFINKEGDLIHRAVGFQNPEKLINSGKLALRKDHNAGEFEQRYKGGERDPEFVLEYLTELKKADKETEKIGLDYLQNESDISPAMKANIAFEAMENIDSKLFILALEGKDLLKVNRTDAEFNRTLKKAAQNTMQTAIQFDSPDLFQETIRDLVLIEMNPDILTELEREYYGKTKNEAAFLKSVEQELQTSNPDKSGLAMDIYAAFPTSKPMLEYARELFDEVYPRNLSMDNLVIGLSLGIGLEDSLYLDEVHELIKIKHDLTDQERQQASALHNKATRYMEQKMQRRN